VLAEIVRLDRAHHRVAAGDSTIAEGVRLAARAHQSMIWMRQRAQNTLRSLLRECYPAALAAFADDLAAARTRKNYAGMAAITRASGTRRVVLARYARNRRLADALYQHAMSH